MKLWATLALVVALLVGPVSYAAADISPCGINSPKPLMAKITFTPRLITLTPKRFLR